MKTGKVNTKASWVKCPVRNLQIQVQAKEAKETSSVKYMKGDKKTGEKGEQRRAGNEAL